MAKVRTSAWGLLFKDGLSKRVYRSREEARFRRSLYAIGIKPSVVRVSITTWGRKGQ